MQLIVTSAAADWIKKHFELNDGDAVRLAPQGQHPHHGPHQRLLVHAPQREVVKTAAQQGITFFITAEDEWFFSGLKITVDYRGDNDVRFDFEDNNGRNPDAETGASQKYEWMWY